MKKHWWKILSVLIMLYVLVVGFLVPLKPGVYNFSPNKLTLGESGTNNTIVINTYNTHLKTANETNVWLKLPNENLIKATKLNISSENQVAATFNIPYALADFDANEDALTLIVENELDGYAFYPDAIHVSQSQTLPIGENSYAPLSVVKEVDKFRFPWRPIIHETIRNTFFHVAIWMSMFILLIISCYHSIRYLIYKDLHSDHWSASLTTVALVFGIAGILTGSMWAKYAWGTFWTPDIKLNMSATAMLVYFAYWFLRASIKDIDTKARLSAVYNIFGFVCLMFLVMVVPRMSGSDSLHPGNGGNPAFGGEDLDNTIRCIFYPAIIGYALIGYWMAQLNYRFLSLKSRLDAQ